MMICIKFSLFKYLVDFLSYQLIPNDISIGQDDQFLCLEVFASWLSWVPQVCSVIHFVLFFSSSFFSFFLLDISFLPTTNPQSLSMAQDSHLSLLLSSIHTHSFDDFIGCHDFKY